MPHAENAPAAQPLGCTPRPVARHALPSYTRCVSPRVTHLITRTRTRTPSMRVCMRACSTQHEYSHGAGRARGVDAGVSSRTFGVMHVETVEPRRARAAVRVLYALNSDDVTGDYSS